MNRLIDIIIGFIIGLFVIIFLKGSKNAKLKKAIEKVDSLNINQLIDLGNEILGRRRNS